jgi:hypothetical protein
MKIHREVSLGNLIVIVIDFSIKKTASLGRGMGQHQAYGHILSKPAIY